MESSKLLIFKTILHYFFTGCLEEELIEGSHQMQIIRAVSDIFSSSMYLDSGAQLWRFLPSLKLNRFTNGYDTFRDLCSVYIARALEDIKNKDPNSEEDPSLLEQFFARFYQVEPAEIIRDFRTQLVQNIYQFNWVLNAQQGFAFIYY
jgi:hypothetical protein